jgi:hypothetical protein
MDNIQTTITNLNRFAFAEVLGALKKDIDNCPDALWEKKFGGDFYWQQVYHAIATTAELLSENMTLPEFPLPMNVSNLEEYPGREYITNYTGAHGKDLMHKSIEVVEKHIGAYFDTLNPDDLMKPIDFFGQQMPLYSKLGITISHIMYHVGALDAALRDHGAKASM